MPRIAPLVFVSSTKHDLADYRLAVQQSLPALDILYRGMEIFGSRPHRAREVIEQELVECDLYLGILAHRYGSVEPLSRLSYTETEYRIARREGIETIVFMIDSNQPVPRGSIESDPEGERKLAKFKEMVRKETVVETFTTPEDLVGKVGLSLQKWLDVHKPEFRRMLHVPLNEFENESIRRLYYADPNDVTRAISRLHRVDCRAPYEHLYGMLHRQDLSIEIARECFRELKFSSDNTRVSQMLVNLIADVPQLRPLTVSAIGERSTLTDRALTEAEFVAVAGLATDCDDEIRYEVAHALGKIVSNYPAHTAICRGLLEQLQKDSASKVRDKALASMHHLPQGTPTRRRP